MVDPTQYIRKGCAVHMTLFDTREILDMEQTLLAAGYDSNSTYPSYVVEVRWDGGLLDLLVY